MKHSLFIIFFIVIFTNLIYAQNPESAELSINWNKEIKNPDNNSLILNFEGASYPDSENILPVYHTLIKLDNDYIGKKISVNITINSVIDISENLKNNIPALMRSEQKFKTVNLSYSVVTQRNMPFLKLNFIPVIQTEKGFAKIEKFKIEYQVSGDVKQGNPEKTYVENSVLKTGKWYKIPIPESGVYKITYAELEALGIKNPSAVRIFGNATGMLSFMYDENSYMPDDLVENYIMKDAQAIYFYAQGPNRWEFNSATNIFEPVTHLYSDYSYYFISEDYSSDTDNQIQTLDNSSLVSSYATSVYNGYDVIDNDALNISKSGRIWYDDENFAFNPVQEYRFNFPNLVNNSTAVLNFALAANSSVTSSFTCSVNDVSKNVYVYPAGSHDFGRRVSSNLEFNTESSDNIDIKLEFSGTYGAEAWLDYLYINAPQELIYDNRQLQFRKAPLYNQSAVYEYSISNADNDLIIWDLTKKEQPVEIQTDINESVLSFKAENDFTEFVAFKKSDAKLINTAGILPVENQNLHAISGNTDMIIITHPLFLKYALEIKDLHEKNDNMNVAVVTTVQVYNEFSSGMPDVTAYRNFAKYIYQKGEGHLKYMMFFGDGSYHNKGNPETYRNYILTFESENSETANSYVTDDYFALLDEGEGVIRNSFYGLLDIGIGRIPASDTVQARTAINKIEEHLNPENYADWRNQLCFIADDQNLGQFEHMQDADTLTEYINYYYPQFNIEKIYLDAFQQYTLSGGERYPDVNIAIRNRVQNGALIMSYTGHGGPKGLSDERVITISEIDNWYNPDRAALWVTATCEFTPYDHYETFSAGEHLFFNPEGGAYAMFTTVRLAYIGSNAILTKNFYSNVFQRDTTDAPLRLGDISRLTKNNNLSYNTFIFTLLGDPALTLGYADNKVKTTHINNIEIENFTDTIQAYDEISFSGIITDYKGNELNDFNGFIYPTVYDKFRDITTLDNDGYGAFEFRSRDNIVYKGKATVTNGKFDFSFIVPRDIMLNIDKGKISYYAVADGRHASGAYEEFEIGGISDNTITDNQGPEITLYMNNRNFTEGGITNQNPMLLADLWDESGINTASGGVGHDISAIIDGDTQKTYILNNGYRANADDYQSGTVEYFLSDIPLGEHTLLLKAWDVYNNSSTKELDFVVVDGDELQIEDLICYPNPMSDETNIYFEHNKNAQVLTITIDFFNLSGKHITSIRQDYEAEGYRAGPFTWNGYAGNGSQVPPGMYIYRVTVQTKDGQSKQLSAKLILIK